MTTHHVSLWDQHHSFIQRTRRPTNFDQSALRRGPGDNGLPFLRRSLHGTFTLLNICVDVAGWPDASCRFPDWLSEVTWRDLDGQSRYGVDDESMTFFVHSSSSSKQHHHQADVRSEFRCLEKTTETDRQLVVYAFAMHNWLVIGKYRVFCDDEIKR